MNILENNSWNILFFINLFGKSLEKVLNVLVFLKWHCSRIEARSNGESQLENA